MRPSLTLCSIAYRSCGKDASEKFWSTSTASPRPGRDAGCSSSALGALSLLAEFHSKKVLEKTAKPFKIVSRLHRCAGHTLTLSVHRARVSPCGDPFPSPVLLSLTLARHQSARSPRCRQPRYTLSSVQYFRSSQCLSNLDVDLGERMAALRAPSYISVCEPIRDVREKCPNTMYTTKANPGTVYVGSENFRGEARAGGRRRPASPLVA